jgi:translation initiation factor 2B subunit (eIF-2B alpha/beta/delta family)
VWVSETRPRLQGAHLTAWELATRGVPHTVFVDSASGLLMRRGEVDLVIVGADRVAANGDVCNKIGTYDKALAAADNGVPFFAAVPSPTFDFALDSGAAIPIEARDADEVLSVTGSDGEGQPASLRVTPPGTRAVNTPSTSPRRDSSQGSRNGHRVRRGRDSGSFPARMARRAGVEPSRGRVAERLGAAARTMRKPPGGRG